VSASGRPETYVPVEIADGVRASARRTPRAVALEEGTRRLTYAALVERIDRVANGAAGLGLEPGRHAAILAPNCLEYFELTLGLASAGNPPALLNARSKPGEVTAACNDAEARVLFVHRSLEEVARSADLATVERIVVVGGDYEDWLAGARPVRPAERHEEWKTFLIPYTTGTTGAPKGVLIPHRSRVLLLHAMGVEYGGFGPQTRSLGVAPFSHVLSFTWALAPVFFGGTCTIAPIFHPELALRTIAEKRLTHAFLVPTHFNALFALGDEALRRHPTPDLRVLASGAAPLGQSSKEWIVAHFGEVLYESYGSTEAGMVAKLNPPDQLRKQSCVGLPFSVTEIRLLDEDGAEVEPGEIGEVFSRSPFHFNGYWKQPEQTAAHFRDGFLSVGDLGRLDDEGYLYLVDRKDDKIVSGGVNVHPREVENVLADHPAVAEAAAFAVPDPYLGEAIRVSVALRPGASADADALREFCSRRLPRHKRPQAIDIVEHLPRTPAGKILRRELREPFWAGHERRIS
jgi:long-chain acyl-CoA synthetase